MLRIASAWVPNADKRTVQIKILTKGKTTAITPPPTKGENANVARTQGLPASIPPP
jgi:hypothetical protein